MTRSRGAGNSLGNPPCPGERKWRADRRPRYARLLDHQLAEPRLSGKPRRILHVFEQRIHKRCVSQLLSFLLVNEKDTTFNPLVGGSNPPRPTNSFKALPR